MTRLEAVRKILTRCGFGDVQSLDTGGASMASYAERHLDLVIVEVQTEGWHFNTLARVTAEPDGSDHIEAPSGTILMDTDGEDAHRDVAQVGGRLYDKDENTDEFTSSVSTEQVLNRSFGCIPFPIQNYIVARAALGFVVVHKPMERMLIRSVEADLAKAKVEANRYEVRQSDVNLLKTPWMQRAVGRASTHGLGGRYRP